VALKADYGLEVLAHARGELSRSRPDRDRSRHGAAVGLTDEKAVAAGVVDVTRGSAE
jgi:hypothetical protein